MNNLISSNNVNITVANQVFSIPVEKLPQVVSFLRSLQGIHIAENPSPHIQYQGRSLING